jgi:uncharacterized membrane protein YkvA (DUF1232 family)
VSGRYKAIPLRIIISIVAAILYFVSPIDLVPDFIFPVGLLDDAAIIGIVISLGAGAEIEKYRKWKRDSEIKEIDNIISEYQANNGLDQEEEEDEE